MMQVIGRLGVAVTLSLFAGSVLFGGVVAGQADQAPVGETRSGFSTTALMLSAVERGLRVKFADVPVVTSVALAETLGQTARESGSAATSAPAPLLFDVRRTDEFAVSHLDGAIRIDPEMSGADFLAKYGGELHGRTGVFYCSVGVRSAKLISRVLVAAQSVDGLKGSAMELKNLEGGIFRWHNEDRSLVSFSGPTRYVHRFDAYWGRLLSQQTLAVSDPATVR